MNSPSHFTIFLLEFLLQLLVISGAGWILLCVFSPYNTGLSYVEMKNYGYFLLFLPPRPRLTHSSFILIVKRCLVTITAREVKYFILTEKLVQCKSFYLCDVRKENIVVVKKLADLLYSNSTELNGLKDKFVKSRNLFWITGCRDRK